MAIFVLLHHLYKLRLLLLFIVGLPLLGQTQDSIVFKPDYTPMVDWNSLPDTVALEYQVLYPERWAKDSLFYTLQNKRFIDSVLNDSVLNHILYYGNFSDTALHKAALSDTPPSNAANIRKRPVPVWLLWIVLVVLVAVVFLKFANIRFFNLLFLSFVNPKYCDEALREHDTPINIYNLMATLVCALVYTVFIWFVSRNFVQLQLSGSSWVSFMLIFLALAVFYMVRYIAIMLAAAVLEAEYTYGVLVQVTVSGNMWMAILILPVLTLINSAFVGYSSPFMPLYVSLGLLIYLIMKQIRVFIQVYNSFPHSIIYLILYLCALEIAPYLAVFKLVIEQTG